MQDIIHVLWVHEESEVTFFSNRQIAYKICAFLKRSNFWLETQKVIVTA